MTERWYTKYTGPLREFDPMGTHRKDFTPLFGHQVRDLKKKFQLVSIKTRKIKSGLHVASKDTPWIKTISYGADKIRRVTYNKVTRVDFREFREIQDGSTPLFKLQMQVALPKRGQEEDTTKRPGKVIFDEEVLIVFPTNYHKSPPLFKIDNALFNSAASHSQHLIGGYLCILGSAGDWDGDNDSVVTAVLASFDWIVWYYYKHGWVDPDSRR